MATEQKSPFMIYGAFHIPTGTYQTGTNKQGHLSDFYKKRGAAQAMINSLIGERFYIGYQSTSVGKKDDFEIHEFEVSFKRIK